MDAGDSHHIRDSPETYRLPWLSVYPVGLEDSTYLQLSAPALALLRFSRMYQLLSKLTQKIGGIKHR